MSNSNSMLSSISFSLTLYLHLFTENLLPAIYHKLKKLILGDRKADEELEETDPEMKASLDALKGSSRHIIRMGRNEYKRVRKYARFQLCCTCCL